MDAARVMGWATEEIRKTDRDTEWAEVWEGQLHIWNGQIGAWDGQIGLWDLDS